jgi:hypothetical protein
LRVIVAAVNNRVISPPLLYQYQANHTFKLDDIILLMFMFVLSSPVVYSLYISDIILFSTIIISFIVYRPQSFSISASRLTSPVIILRFIVPNSYTVAGRLLVHRPHTLLAGK